MSTRLLVAHRCWVGTGLLIFRNHRHTFDIDIQVAHKTSLSISHLVIHNHDNVCGWRLSIHALQSNVTVIMENAEFLTHI